MGVFVSLKLVRLSLNLSNTKVEDQSRLPYPMGKKYKTYYSRLLFFLKRKRKRKRKEHTKCGEGAFEDIRKIVGLKKKKVGYVKVGAKVYVFMSFREKVIMPTKSSDLLIALPSHIVPSLFYLSFFVILFIRYNILTHQPIKSKLKMYFLFVF